LIKEISGKFSFKINIWTFLFIKTFLAITTHYINKDWKLQNLLLDFVQIYEYYTGENIMNTFVFTLQNF
ncbi:hypothetical protein C1646_601202, partial [Rhizophagus diaphanus]